MERRKKTLCLTERRKRPVKHPEENEANVTLACAAFSRDSCKPAGSTCRWWLRTGPGGRSLRGRPELPRTGPASPRGRRAPAEAADNTPRGPAVGEDGRHKTGEQEQTNLLPTHRSATEAFVNRLTPSVHSPPTAPHPHPHPAVCVLTGVTVALTYGL